MLCRIAIWDLGHFLLCVLEADVRLAAFGDGLGHFVSPSVALVGTGFGASLDCGAADSLGHAGPAQRPTIPNRVRARTAASAIGVVGVALGLRVFMADSIAAAHLGAEAVRHVLPNRFNWPLFCGALLLMSVPVLQLMPTPKQHADEK